MRSMKHLLYFSCVAWDTMQQRPHFIAKELGKLGYRITYLVIGTKNTRRFCPEKNVSVVEVSMIRGYMRSFAVRIVSRLALLFLLPQTRFDAVILTNPVQLNLIPQRWKKLPFFYDCMDLMTGFYQGKKKKLMEESERVLCNCARHILASSLPLKEYLEEQYGTPAERITTVFNAADPEDCMKAEILPGVKHPALIYMGAVEWWVDLPLLKSFMDVEPVFHLYVVGDGNEEQKNLLSEIRNCHYLGRLPHKEALSYVKSADVALMPFLPCPLIDNVDPIKLYEYLALGKPVVSSFWQSVERFSDNPRITFYFRKEEFPNAVKTAALQTEESLTAKEFLHENSWSVRTKVFSSILEERIPENSEII